jgi:tRNA threonylcarbamoyladenosine biosynthesis protein TsaB
MRVLAIDTALEACAAAVLDSERGAIIAGKSLVMTRGHAEALMPLIADVMDQAKIEFAQLDRIAVTTGPGSFTGLRVGLSAARGIGLAAGKPVIGLTTLAGFAAPLIAADGRGPVVAVIDARHQHVYMQIFSADGRTLVAPKIAPLREAGRSVVPGPARVVGSAAELVVSAWPKAELPPSLVEQRGAPDIGWIARLGAAADDAYGPPKPLYLRAPDAQPQDGSRLARR